MNKIKKFYVVGNPIDHSKSPYIHREFASQFGFSIDYRTEKVSKGELANFLSKAQEEGVTGINVTVPLKEEAFSLADESSNRALSAQAANTLCFSGGKIFADNTDGLGVVTDLEQNLGCFLKGKTILIVGAGGAARGILGPVSQRDPRTLFLTNRTLEKSKRLVELYRSKNIEILSWGNGLLQPVDLILNCTSLSLSGKLPAIDKTAIGRETICYDLAYGRHQTPFVKWAIDMGAALAIDGLGMLVEQAAEAFRVWHGPLPSTSGTIEKLRKSIS